ncbi:CDP-diacylglycerol--glycerol-3-phosphate 3-phosphatidyltransferase [[Mycoplasma] gypis]|uniref:CDP-diacylglycerol--glycerol-3-phosphate 3-phosphatidyltransferase n=1 Tax=[Mycoplasma] gypis TaxID=92404 RepID=A0ABZ2RNU9_9BACT|nr:CDP-diacylglycerol--glycerol-3-phosphate 3-phosphatidyltransferase [[Mycoplasma] gypis]MBN0919208.1 CDP-diacylglycerol--glycerol-3-phosphate 3-phosphatidyltransferase [[Mycoplasma] gypis]
MKISNFKTKIPNLLLISRMLFFIPFFIIMIITEFSGYNRTLFLINIAIFAFAMITDFLDGHLARKWNCVSTFGKIFDPIADKVITTAALIFLVEVESSFSFIIVLLILRDLVVDGTRLYAVSKQKEIMANIWGKLKTIIISFAIVIIGFIFPFINHNILNIVLLNIPMYLGLTISLFSGYIYLKGYLKK